MLPAGNIDGVDIKRLRRKYQQTTLHKVSVRASDLKQLPLVNETHSNDKEALLINKVQQCNYIFDFMDSQSESKNKAIKRNALNEIITYITDVHNTLSDNLYHEIIKMITNNLIRTLPSSNYDPIEDDPILEASWPHMQLIYELLLRLIERQTVAQSSSKRILENSFVMQLIQLFDSEDPRERDYLKTILHRIYGKFLVLRAFIRKQLIFILLTFIYETEHFNGIPELLEIVGSIINGFTIPIKAEHKVFLIRVMLPLHSSRSLHVFCTQLAYCIVQYLEKDPYLTEPVIRGILKCWPKTCSNKEVIFLSEMEEILDVISPEQFEKIQVPLFKQIAASASSQHFQVAERALFYWNNDYILSLIHSNNQVLMPILFAPLYQASKEHWNTTISSLIFNVLKSFMEADSKLFGELSNKYRTDLQKEKKKLKEREELWQKLNEYESQRKKQRKNKTK